MGGTLAPRRVGETGVTARVDSWKRALGSWRVWGHLGWRDTKTRYALTVIGPAWTTLSVLITALALGVVYSTMFKTDLKSYLPFVITSLVTWTFISACFSEGPLHYTMSRSMLLNTVFPEQVFTLQFVWKHAITFGMSLPVVLVLNCLLLGLPGPEVLLVIPAVALLFIFLAAATYLLGMAGVKYPDLGTFMPSLLLMAFLVTPILWPPTQLAGREWIYELNPLYWVVAIVREPLLGEAPTLKAWAATLLVVAGVAGVALLVSRSGSRSLKLRL